MFGGKNQRPAATRGTAGMSFIGAEVTITGNIGGTGNLHIDGRVEGDVAATSVIVGQGGHVRGNIVAGDATIAGGVEGTVSAKSLTIEASARIAGDLAYDTVSIASGAEVEGRVKRLTRDEPQRLLGND